MSTRNSVGVHIVLSVRGHLVPFAIVGSLMPLSMVTQQWRSQQSRLLSTGLSWLLDQRHVFEDLVHVYVLHVILGRVECLTGGGFRLYD